MGFPPHLLLPLLLLPFAGSDKIDLFYCEKSSDNQNLVSNARAVVLLLSKLTPVTGFSQLSHGDGAEAVHGLSWCRAELSPHACSHCIFEASDNVLKNCRNSIAARSWSENFCYLRYDTAGFAGTPDTRLVKIGRSKKRIEDPEHRSSFLVTLHQLLEVFRAARPENDEPFVAAKRRFYAENSTVYGEAQCAKDLTAEDCGKCWASQISVFFQNCMYRQYRKSCQVLFGSCFMRYYTKKGIAAA